MSNGNCRRSWRRLKVKSESAQAAEKKTGAVPLLVRGDSVNARNFLAGGAGMTLYFNIS